MGQRKLTEEELQIVMLSRHLLRKVLEFSKHVHYIGVALEQLDAIALHCTTDGKPYVEPQPEIGEGYRRATEADRGRRDLEVWCEGKWQKTLPGLCDGFTYRVPVNPPEPQYRPFANAAEFMPHADRWLKEKLQEDFRATVCAFNDKGFWISGAMVSTTYADGFCIFEFADGTPFGVLINS